MRRIGKRTCKLPPAVSRLFLIDKPAGVSSFGALSGLKRAVNTKKVGHAGTLDPFATGLLIALSGKMTRAVSLVSDADKEYIATIRFGRETNTLDTEGETTAEAGIPSFEAIELAAMAFLGEISQVPPIFSAVKIEGKRAYRSARDGKDVQMPERTVFIREFEILSWKSPDLEVRIRCSKGTYIRSIARDLGLAAGSRAYCAALRRTAIGPFRVESARLPDACSPDDGLPPIAAFRALGIPVEAVDADTARELRAGVPLDRIKGIRIPDGPLVCWADEEGGAAALTRRDGGRSVYSIVFDD